MIQWGDTILSLAGARAHMNAADQEVTAPQVWQLSRRCSSSLHVGLSVDAMPNNVFKFAVSCPASL